MLKIQRFFFFFASQYNVFKVYLSDIGSAIMGLLCSSGMQMIVANDRVEH